MPDYRSLDEKIHELQESMQKLQLLKQIGADNLIVKQEKEIFEIQQEIMELNKETSLDVSDILLPRKCRFCSDVPEDEKFDCYEKKGASCNKKEPPQMSLLSMQILKIVLMYIVIMLLLFAFLLISNILFNYIDNRLVVFFLSLSLTGGIIGLFFKPVKQLFHMI